MFLKKPNFTWISEKIEIQHSRIFFGKTKKKFSGDIRKSQSVKDISCQK